MTKQQGFTLIELMIVVAVIGVLSAIAIPQYQKYVAKAEVASVLTTMTGVKTNVEAFVVENGEFPGGVDGRRPSDLGAPDNMPLGVFTFEDFKDDTGKIKLTFKSEGVNALLKNDSLVLTRATETGTWTCTSSNIEKALIPKGCTSTATSN